MTTQISKEAKQKIDELCRKYKVKELSLFGSRGRGDFSENSDFDFLVEFNPDADIGLFQFSKIQIALEEVLGTDVDLVSKKGLKARIKERILSEAEIVYAQ